MRRALRLVFYAFFATSASVGALIATTQVIAALGHAPSALPLNDVAQSLGIDIGAVIVFVLLFRSDFRARPPPSRAPVPVTPCGGQACGKSASMCSHSLAQCTRKERRVHATCHSFQQASVLLQMQCTDRAYTL